MPMAPFRGGSGHKIINASAIHKDCVYPQHKLRRSLLWPEPPSRWTYPVINRTRLSRIVWLAVDSFVVGFFHEISVVISKGGVGNRRRYPSFPGRVCLVRLLWISFQWCSPSDCSAVVIPILAQPDKPARGASCVPIPVMPERLVQEELALPAILNILCITFLGFQSSVRISDSFWLCCLWFVFHR